MGQKVKIWNFEKALESSEAQCIWQGTLQVCRSAGFLMRTLHSHLAQSAPVKNMGKSARNTASLQSASASSKFRLGFAQVAASQAKQ